MKKTNKLLSVVLSVVMILSVMSVIPFTASAETYGIFEYEIYNDKVEIHGLTNTYIGGDIVIPSNISGYPVTSIGWNAFNGCTGIKSVTIPNSVTSINSGAFSGCLALKSITLPNNIADIGVNVFSDCIKLNNVTIPDSLNAISDGLFYGCKGLKSVIIGKETTSIGNSAFYGCEQLESINLPDKVTAIEGWAFCGCARLASIFIPDSVTIIGDKAFNGCISLTSVTIPKFVTSIGDYAFRNCIGIKSVVIPNSVTDIGDWAFSDCTGLETVTIGNSLTSTGYATFSRCTKLKSVSFGNSLTTIDSDAFYGCVSLESVNIPNSVTSIEYSAFENCSGLSDVIIGKGVTAIKGDAFSNCTNLSHITIPDSVTFIGGSAFCGCVGLNSIMISSGVTQIGYLAFDDCENLKDVYYMGTYQDKLDIDIDEYGNSCLLDATWHYNYVPQICKHSSTEIINQRATTCAQDGYTGDTYCKDCGQLIEKGMVILTLGHSSVWKTVKKATFTETGLKQEICTECGEVLGEEVIPVLTETYSLETAKVNEAENISVAVSEGSNLPETAEIVVQKAEVTESSITYDIHIENEGIKVQPGAPVLVKVPIPAGFDKSKLNVFRKEQDGSKTRMEIVIDGDYAYFETDHFSIYEIIEKLCGDINGDDKVNNKDLTRLFQKLSGWSVETSEAALDINGDGKVNNKDLTRLFQYLSGWAVEIY